LLGAKIGKQPFAEIKTKEKRLIVEKYSKIKRYLTARMKY